MRPHAVVGFFPYPQGWAEGGELKIAVVALIELLRVGALRPRDAPWLPLPPPPQELPGVGYSRERAETMWFWDT